MTFYNKDGTWNETWASWSVIVLCPSPKYISLTNQKGSSFFVPQGPFPGPYEAPSNQESFTFSQVIAVPFSQVIAVFAVK